MSTGEGFVRGEGILGLIRVHQGGSPCPNRPSTEDFAVGVGAGVGFGAGDGLGAGDGFAGGCWVGGGWVGGGWVGGGWVGGGCLPGRGFCTALLLLAAFVTGASTAGAASDAEPLAAARWCWCCCCFILTISACNLSIFWRSACLAASASCAADSSCANRHCAPH